MSRNGQRQSFIITCASYQKEITMAAQSNSPYGENRIRLGQEPDSAQTLVVRQRESGFSFSPPTHQGVGEEYSSLSPQSSMGSRQPRLCADFLMNFVVRVEREEHSRQLSRNLSY